jgi:hypothetical protein
LAIKFNTQTEGFSSFQKGGTSSVYTLSAATNKEIKNKPE